MLYTVSYTTKAMADVSSILAWFDAQGANEAGDRWFIQLYDKIDSLEKQPQRYSLVPEYSQSGLEIREFLYGSRANKHRVIFRVHHDRVFVLRIWHRARGQLNFEDLT